MTAKLPCPRCGVIDTPRTEPGSGPHAARLVCGHCGGFIKWIPKERSTTVYLNEVTLIGTLAREPEQRQTDTGKGYVSAVLCIEEPGEDRTFRTFVPLVAYGRAACVLRDLAEGTPVLLKGKLGYRSWQQDGKKTGRVEVTAWTVQAVPLATPAAVAQN